MGTYLDQTELYLFNEGKSAYAYRALGCHRVTMEDGGAAYRFAVWGAERAERERVGSFNNWDVNANIMEPCFTTGVWQAAYKKRLRGGFMTNSQYIRRMSSLFSRPIRSRFILRCGPIRRP